MTFEARDGASLDGDLIAPPSGVEVRGTVVVCHPHPQYGGNRHHPVVDSVSTTAACSGFVALRFDFRRAFDDGRGERLDVLAAIERVRLEHVDGPTALIGYSFGAVMALAATTGDDASEPAVIALGLIAPPLTMSGATSPPGHHGPTLVLVPERDQFGPPDTTGPAVDEWPDTEFGVVEGADHFLMGSASDVARRIIAWLDALSFGA